MTEVKVSVNITLQGGVMLTQDEAKHLEKENGTGFELVKVKVKNENGKTETINAKARKFKTITQVINMNKEAYAYMTSREGCLPGISQSVWNKMPSEARLEAHLKLTAKSLGGKLHTYKVFDD